MNRRLENVQKVSSMKNIKSGINEVVKRRSGSTTRESSNKSTPNGIVLIDNDTTTVEVTVKKKARKLTPNASDNKTFDRKSSDAKRLDGLQHHHWSRILREQNIPALKQALQQTTSPHDQKIRYKLENDDKELRKSGEKKKPCVYINHEASFEELQSKQSSSPRKSRDRSKSNVRSTRSALSSESVIVYDKGVQCGGIFDGTNENFRRLNPVRALGFLMKELEHVIEGDKASKILTEMQQALLRVPIEPGQLSHVDMETIAAKARLEASTAKLEATCKTMEDSYKSVRKENVVLQQRIQELSSLLKRTKAREGEIEIELEQMKADLNEALKSDLANRKIINDLKEETRQINMLKKELTDEMEEAEHLRLEKEKLTIMSSYKDSEFRKLRDSIKELQNNVASQLKGLNDFSKSNEVMVNPDHHSTMLPKTVQNSSTQIHNNAPAPLSWQEISELSMSVDPYHHPGCPLEKMKHQRIALSDTHDGIDNAKFYEKTHLDFVSLANQSSQSSSLSDNQNDDMKSADEVDTSKNNNLSHESQKRKKRVRSRTRKSIDKSRSPGNKTLVASENSGYHDSVVSSVNMIDKKAKAEIQVLFDNIRQKSKLPFSVPSPPRNFPNPNWSDSTLPTMSLTESNSG